MKHISFKKRIASIIIGLAMMMTITSGASAEQEALAPQETIVATVDFNTAGITKQSGNEITIAFDLANKVGVQSQIRYDVFLTRVSGGDMAVLDKKVYDEVLTLEEEASIQKEVVYEAPSFLRGEYLVTLEAFTSSGLPLAAVSLGAITLEGTGEYIEIIPSSCYFKVGEKGEIFPAFQGVDITRKESLRLECKVKSGFSADVKAYPAITTYGDAEVGMLVSRVKKVPLTVIKGGERSMEIEVPLSSDPGAYVATVVLEDENGIAASNAVATHYIIQGPSASAQNVVFDKSTYKKGEMANVSLTWFGSAGPFSGARLENEHIGESRITVTLANKQGMQCAEPYSATQEEGWRVMSMQMKITKDCEDVNATVVTQNTSGGVIDTTIFATKQVASEEAGGSSKNAILWVMGALVAILVAALGFWFMRKRSSIAKTSIIAVMCVLGGGMVFGSAQAMTRLDGVGPSGYIQTNQTAQDIANAMFESARTAGTQRSEDIRNTQLTYCSYLGYATAASACRPPQTPTQPQPPRPPVQTQTPPPPPSRSSGGIPYTPQPPAACGSANGQQYTSQPYTGLCIGVSATQMSGSNPWTWRCGSNYCSTSAGTAGRCGLASYGRTYGERPTEELCSIGSPSLATLQPSGTGMGGQTLYEWRWVCYGVNGGNLAYCSATKGPTPRVDGACGTANGQTLVNAPATGLCARGTASSIYGTDPWDWNCFGSGGGWPASCRAFKAAPAVSGVCGTANGQGRTSAPSSNLCSTGSASSVTGSGPWNWTCTGSGSGAPASCSAPRLINGSCGSANGQQHTHTPIIGLCNAGVAWYVSGSGPWNWTCSGSGGGSSASCSAPVVAPAINGSCGTANGQARTTAPSTNLCSIGTASTVTGSGPWDWTCTGSGGGSTASCTAPKGMRIIEI